MRLSMRTLQNKQQWQSYLLMLLVSVLLFGCGGSSSSPNDQTIIPSVIPPAPVVLTGAFIDAPVQGLTYETESQTGITNELGEFLYQEGEIITFSLGGIVFPQVIADSVITPLTIFSTDDVNHTGVVNMLRFLQSIDEDGNLDNGITIGTIITELAKNIVLDFNTQAAEEILNGLLSSSSGIHQLLIPSEDAIYHFLQSLQALDITNLESCDATHEMIGYTGSFQTYAHNVSGNARIVDDCTIEITNFTYDGLGPEVYFYGGIDHNYSTNNGIKISARINGKEYNNEKIIVRLPQGVTFEQLNGISVWCVDFQANFGI